VFGLKYTFVLFVAILGNAPSAAPASIRDAIRQAREAEAQAQEMYRQADQQRQEAYRLWEETKVARFQYAHDTFRSARYSFEQAAKYFNSARYHLELMEEYHSDHSAEIEKYFRWASEKFDDGAASMSAGIEKFNAGVQEYNERQAEQRRRAAEKDWSDAQELEKQIAAALNELTSSGKGSSSAAACLQRAASLARDARTEFYIAMKESRDPESYRRHLEAAVGSFNAAVRISRQVAEKGTCES
jgi:hypothetical protein